ncbi:penicillin-binding protein [Pontibacter beigongshangensis]|uniref:penicillin-binding protein n=1 Tax=Pontibacter beigongshangensis TaxID=2574733 RepID=UPI00165094DA|nr:penicillin-binding protein [Pontibacter beigongshangensis]
MNIKKSILVRVRVAFLAICLFACAIVYKIVHIQFLDDTNWKAISKERRVRYQPVFATRGNIYSDNDVSSGNESILATSLPFYRVAFDPTIAETQVFNAGVDSLAMLLARFYGDKSEDHYRRRIKNARTNGRRYIRLNSRQINYQDKKMMAQWPIFRAGKNRGGVIFEKVEKRFKPFGLLAERTIGFINVDKNGAGLEFSFNDNLAGTDGEALFERIAGGNKPIYDGTEVKPQHGYDIKTTIDINLQDVAENALYKALEKTDADYGCVIMMEVKTGEIKAIANLGKTKGGYIEDYNYAVGNQGRTEPGSTFKLAAMMALFEHTNLQLTDTVDTGKGTFRLKGRTMTDSRIGGYGKITVQEVFEKSSNIGVAKLTDEYFAENPTAFTDYLNRFGLGSTLGFQMDGEARPYIKSPQDRSWSATSLASMSIGYELKLSPLQTLAFYNAVANNGVKIQPIIVKEIRKADNVIQTFKTRVLDEKICSDETLKKLRAMMEGVVENGTARNIRSNDYKVAGKTGTARKVKNGRYVKTYSTSFAGYFPADNPKYSCIVIIDSPRGVNVYGGDVAAPVFKELADKAYARDLAMHKPLLARVVPNKESLPNIRSGSYDDLSLICNKIGISSHSQSPDEDWVHVETRQRSLVFKPNPVNNATVPDVTGMTLRDALYILENQRLRVKVEGTGKRVQRQSLAPGTAIDKDGQIVIVMS